jgi:hypothetical protein
VLTPPSPLLQVAIITGRTLVLPPATGWYLIDYGPIGAKAMQNGVRENADLGSLSEV